MKEKRRRLQESTRHNENNMKDDTNNQNTMDIEDETVTEVTVGPSDTKHSHPTTQSTRTPNNTQNTDNNTFTSTTGNTQDTNKTNTTQENNKYNDSDNGQFFNIILEKDNINELQVGTLLKRLNVRNINCISKTGKNRVKVTLTDRKDANSILSNVNLAKLHNIKSFIPNIYIFTEGIVRDVPAEMPVDELLDNYRIDGNIRIHKIERMTYWDKTAKIAKPSNNIKITFRSATLPTEMKLCYTIKKITPFIPRPTFCKKCSRYGHVEKICKSDKTCMNCTAATHAYNSTCACEHCTRKCLTLCKYCNTNDHCAAQNVCPEYKKQLTIKTLMITKRLSFVEAKNATEKPLTSDSITYAGSVNLLSRMDKLIDEIDQLKKLNRTLLERVQESEKIIDDLNINDIITNIQNTIKTNKTDANIDTSIINNENFSNIINKINVFRSKYKKPNITNTKNK